MADPRWQQLDGSWVLAPETGCDLRASMVWQPGGERWVVVENHGEHHMGAESVVVVPDRPLAGIARFQTTNGAAMFDGSGRWLVIGGVAGFVVLDLVDESARHHCMESGHVLSRLRVENGRVTWSRIDVVRRDRVERSVSLADGRELAAGFGPFAGGDFRPHPPFVEWWEGWTASGRRAAELGPLPDRRPPARRSRRRRRSFR